MVYNNLGISFPAGYPIYTLLFTHHNRISKNISYQSKDFRALCRKGLYPSSGQWDFCVSFVWQLLQIFLRKSWLLVDLYLDHEYTHLTLEMRGLNREKSCALRLCGAEPAINPELISALHLWEKGKFHLIQATVIWGANQWSQN